MAFKIYDWAGNPILPEHEFISFDDGWGRIYELCNDLYGENYDDAILGEYQVLEVTK